MNTFSESDIISGYNFSQKCNFIYSRYISHYEFNLMNNKDVTIMQKTKDYVFYRMNYVELKDGYTIFSNNFALKTLFRILNQASNFSNIKLVTSQTDLSITNEIFTTMPKCISHWYSINVNYEDRALTPIPLGIGNSFQDKYITDNLFYSADMDVQSKKTSKLYVNFRENTNTKHRKNLQDYFRDKNWATVDSPNLTPEEYVNNIKNHDFILSPWGNGIDTHRIWESLYIGAIPVTKYHHTLSTLNDLPVLFINNYEDLSQDHLLKAKNEIDSNEFNFEKLKTDWWVNEVINIRDYHNDINPQIFRGSQFFNSIDKLLFSIGREIENKMKKLRYYVKKILGLFRNI